MAWVRLIYLIADFHFTMCTKILQLNIGGIIVDDDKELATNVN